MVTDAPNANQIFIPPKPFELLIEASLDAILEPLFDQCNSNMKEMLTEYRILDYFSMFSNLFLMVTGELNFLFDHSRPIDELSADFLLADFLDCTSVKSLTIDASQVHISLDQREGIRSFSVEFKLPWPINQIIFKSDIQVYNRAMSVLIRLYTAHKELNRASCLSPATFKTADRLHHQAFLNNLINSMCHGVIFELVSDRGLDDACTIEQFKARHQAFLAKLSKELLLNVFICLI